MAGRQDVLLRGQPEPAPEGITHGVQLTSGNTGPTGSLTDQSTSGGTISAGDYASKAFPDPSPDGWYTIGNGPASFTDCRFDRWVLVDTATDLDFVRCGFSGGFSLSTSHRVTFTDCHIYDPGADHCQVTGDSPAGSTCDDVTMTRCLFDGIIPANVAEGVHLDGIQTRGVQRLLLDRCAWRMGDQWDNAGDPLPINAAVFFENANGGSTDVEMRDCYLDGGIQVLFLQSFSGYLKITGNRWGPRFSGERVRNDVPITPTVWSGNVVDADETVLNY